jgi:hypothetical protein
VTKTIVDDIKLCTKYVVVELLCWCLYRQEHVVTCVRVYADEFTLSLGLVCDYQVTCWRMILAGHVVECQLDSFIT